MQMSLWDLSLCEEVKSLTPSILAPSFFWGGGIRVPISCSCHGYCSQEMVSSVFTTMLPTEEDQVNIPP